MIDGLRRATGAIVITLLTSAVCQADPLREGFRTPPSAAKPRVWWHWMNGNVTKDGIRSDLDWMNRIGIGGVGAIDASIDTPQVVEKRLVYMTPEWKEAFRYASDLTGRHGMELSIDSSPGWSETGGPWVSPQSAMKKLVWSSMAVDGGRPFHARLPEPPANPGPFQNIPRIVPGIGNFYRDSLVIAYRVPAADPAVVAADSNAGPVDAAMLKDGDLSKAITLKPPGTPVWIRAAYATPVRIQGVTLALSTNDGLGFAASVEASDDGNTWHAVTDIPKAAQVRRFALLQQTVAFAPVTAKFFRLVIKPDVPIPTSLRIVDSAPGLADAPSPPAPTEEARSYRLFELVFHARATVHEFEKKAGFAIARDNHAIAAPVEAVPGTMVRRGDVVDLTSRMSVDGVLDWTPPQGRWTVLRLGYSLTGAQNHPATAEATGLEVDKLNRAHVRAYMEHYLDTYGDGPTSLTVDSTEVGAQNWTETILEDFRRLRGYDPVPWLPALTGAVVQSAGDSDKFLWDFRRTIAQLLAENHYGEIARIASERGLLDYAEALEDHRPTFGDDIEMRRYAKIPMAAMWAYGSRRAPLPTYVADIQGAASVAHVYGRDLVAAESLTSAGQPWAYAPRTLKPVVDMEFVLGVNRVVIHTSVHQPVDRAPGLSLNAYGQFFNRLESWAELAKGWIDYIARCSFLLQQGRAAADIAYFYGEEAPITGLFGDAAVDVPRGYGFDFVGSDAVLNRLSVDHGELVTPSGMRYRLLYLGGSSRFMTLKVLKRLSDLVAQGAVVAGQKPIGSPSLADDAKQFEALAQSLFGANEHGQGRVFASLDAALAGLPPDFDYTAQAGSEVLATHRHLQDGELYFLTNRLERRETLKASFRVAGLSAEVWDAVTGSVAKVPVTQDKGRSLVSLDLPAYGSAFVIFRKGAASAAAPAPSAPLRELRGPWHITFQPGRGIDKPVTRSSLSSWSDDPALRYFSGTATYTTQFDLPVSAVKGRLTLDLGDVREVAEVRLNGKLLGTAWTAPFALDLTGARPGRNELSIKVANLWVNRLIGDVQPGTQEKHAFTTIPTFRADAPLRPSGLLGPVILRKSKD
jgi:hypothetical protein